ncbi:MAG: hypothetical protein GFH27_549283n61 [Chloroflexi bacterium AL-W]|nr:hypothetical protein [Chloroflexi bacterium AL-N1]NOK64818.1 hypothetical protein [Chloroflexi bacterium AL-N10]NOK76588.1 hypothetical protein [Chloroflexi bacterium AL-N5]NOK80182.1 hypothetical protein [Chloroflexi bacterium AL-W]NOK86695.1 hypothetical protein [Chloroflexi bacterium AL-N15]
MFRISPFIFILIFLTACTLPFNQPILTEGATVPRPQNAATAPVEEQTEPPTAIPDTQTQPTDIQNDTTNGATTDNLEELANTTPADRDQVALVEALTGNDLPEFARTEPLDVQVGDTETFWVSDILNDSNYEVDARLRYAGPHVLMYFETAVDDQIRQEDIDRAAQEFEERIYPRNRALFGEELSPGVDGDTRLTILNITLQGAGGYFSSADSVVQEVNRFSNEREMFVVGLNSFPVGESSYGSVLAHEFQHMIHWHEQRRGPAWFNEGLSTLAEDLNDFGDDNTTILHIQNPDIQLTTWSNNAAQTGQHYGTSQLFMRYVYEQYAQDGGLAQLIQDDAGNNLAAFATMAQQTRPDINSFADIVADWAVANLVNNPSIDDGRYAYSLLPETTTPVDLELNTINDINQFGADYLTLPTGTTTLTFDGSDTVSLTGATPNSGQYAWWSNRGDDSVSTLTRSFDLRDLTQATLQFSLWHEIEYNWDYGYVAVSTDSGETWTTLEGQTTTKEDPQGNNAGTYGLTGISGKPGIETDQGEVGQWIEEQMDLTPFVGQEIQVRFWLIQDDAYNANGMLIDDVRIPELDYVDDFEEADESWEGQGFVRTTGTLPQQWTLRLVKEVGSETIVESVETNEAGQANISVNDGETGVLVVVASTPYTTQTATYTIQSETR